MPPGHGPGRSRSRGDRACRPGMEPLEGRVVLDAAGWAVTEVEHGDGVRGDRWLVVRAARA